MRSEGIPYPAPAGCNSKLAQHSKLQYSRPQRFA